MVRRRGCGLQDGMNSSYVSATQHLNFQQLFTCPIAASEAETEWSDGVAVGYKMEQQRRLGVGFLPLLRTKPVWAICVAQYTGSWGFYGECAK